MRVVLAPEVEVDIEGILDFIAVDSPRNAVSYVAGLRKKMKSLSRYPRIYALRENLPPGTRAAVYGSHLILFHIGAKSVEVSRVVHGAMDLTRLFEK